MSARGPIPLLASLPSALGHDPARELVIVGISQRATHVAVVLTIPGDDSDLLLDDAGRQLLRDGASHAVVVSYDADPRLTELAGVLLPTLGVTVLDVLAVHDGRWRSLACTDPSCCPPEGTPLPTPTENQENTTP